MVVGDRVVMRIPWSEAILRRAGMTRRTDILSRLEIRVTNRIIINNTKVTQPNQLNTAVTQIFNEVPPPPYRIIEATR